MGRYISYIGPQKLNVESKRCGSGSRDFKLSLGNINRSNMSAQAGKGKDGMVVAATDDTYVLARQIADEVMDQSDCPTLEGQLWIRYTLLPQPVVITQFLPVVSSVIPMSSVCFVPLVNRRHGEYVYFNLEWSRELEEGPPIWWWAAIRYTDASAGSSARPPIAQ